MKIKGRDWDRGRTGRHAEIYLKTFENKTRGVGGKSLEGKFFDSIGKQR